MMTRELAVIFGSEMKHTGVMFFSILLRENNLPGFKSGELDE